MSHPLAIKYFQTCTASSPPLMTLSTESKDKIFALKDANCTWEQIAIAVGSTKEAVRQYHYRNRHLRHLPPRPKVSKAKTSGRVGLKIKRIIAENPTISVRNIPSKLIEAGIPETSVPSRSTVGRFLKKNRLIKLNLLKKPLISAVNKLKRVEFARQFQERSGYLKYYTIWSDETTVKKCPSNLEIQYRVHASVSREDLPRVARVQAGGFSVMFWGCFSYFGLGPLVALEGMQNQHTYIDLLKDYLIDELQAAREQYGVNLVFMQDNAPCHKSRLVTRFLAEQRVRTLDWPPQSPDLNPIENLWSVIKRRRQAKYGLPTSREELIQQVFDIWENIDDTVLNNLLKSIDKRLSEVIRLGGAPTKY